MSLSRRRLLGFMAVAPVVAALPAVSRAEAAPEIESGYQVRTMMDAYTRKFGQAIAEDRHRQLKEFADWLTVKPDEFQRLAPKFGFERVK